MSHTTNVYYKDRLGFEPEYESRMQQSSSQQQTSVTKSTLYSSNVSASSTVRSSSQSQTKATVHHQSASHSSASNNHYSNGSNQQAITSSNSHSATADSSQHVSGHGVYEENLTKFKGPSNFVNQLYMTQRLCCVLIIVVEKLLGRTDIEQALAVRTVL